MSPVEHFPLVESERIALRRYAAGLDDWEIAVLIESAVWNVEHLETQLEGAVKERDRLREVLRAVLMEPDPIKRNQLAAPVLTNPGGR